MPSGARARQRVGRDEGAGVVLDAVDAVGVGGQRPHAGLALQRERQPSRTRRRGRRGRARGLGRLHRHRGLAAATGSRRAARTAGRAAPPRAPAPRAPCPTSRDSPSISSLRMCACDARLARARRGGRFQGLLRRGDQVHLVAGEQPRRRAWAFPARPAPAGPCARRGTLDAVALRGWRSASAQVVASGTVGPLAMTAGSSPGTSLMVSVTTLRRRAGRGQPPALDARQVLAHAVHLADVGAAVQQLAG